MYLVGFIHDVSSIFEGSFKLYYQPENPLTPSLNYKEGFTHEAEIQVLPFSSIETEKIDAMKIDVEGMEVEVMKGMFAYLEKFKPKIIIEILDDNKLKAIQELLSPIGYSNEAIIENSGASKNYKFINSL